MIELWRKKPVVIETVKFTEETREFIIKWTGCRHTFMDDDGCLQETYNLFIQTLEGEMMARPGDYIIRGVEGEFYPCEPNIFSKTYEKES